MHLRLETSSWWFISHFILLVLSLGGCDQQEPGRSFDPSRFPIPSADFVYVCFDFSKEDIPSGAVLSAQIKGQEAGPIILPFHATISPSSHAEYAHASTRGGGTGGTAAASIISVLNPPKPGSPLAIKYSPTFDPAPKVDSLAYRGNVYWHKEGLRRTFFYRFPNSNNHYDSWPTHLKDLKAYLTANAIVIAIPEGSTRREVSPGKSEMPQGEVHSEWCRIYRVPTLNPNKTRSDPAVMVSYDVPPSPAQNYFKEYSPHVLVFVFSLLCWFGINPLKPELKKYRTYIIAISTVFLLIANAVLYYFLVRHGTWPTSQLVFLNGIALCGAGAAVLLDFAKSIYGLKT